MTELSIYQIIPKVREEVGVIRKDKSPSQGPSYSYRSTDQIINALAPVLNKYGVFTTVEDIDYTHSSELTQSKKVLTTVTLRKKVTFYGPKGDSVTSIVAGENSDYSDKATGGASTYAYRYALVQTFVLPTDEDDPDAKYVEKEAPAEVADPNAPKIESRQDVKNRLISKSKNAKNNVKGREYLTTLVNSGGFDGRDFDSVWTTGTTEDLLKLEATFDVAEASK